ncbi:hypothetical protein FVEN_g5757 [Fusarium venenatum]|uniref:Cytidyltransferase-like domain-containing protein n=1 Tax=Fusarium venenatum TaxID=56646 RepID=A0A2L2TTJ9_9HYPO|nr:uncharacterized protein FVRRES_03858 [Fusarium venenatum]KAG8356445.1 hypothetical protein FVEN_g5757 [Fusarium venenatum]CEI67346.1 unnamed protein product [Fusarium venenatum]
MAFARLANYVERLMPLNEKPSNPSDRPFNNGTAKNPPLLRSQGVNHILLYPGSFNPPHQGHLNLLKHVFKHAGADLNMVAAIVVLTSDEKVQSKMKGRDNAIAIPKDKRIKLWRGQGIPVDWAWVYDCSESWGKFRARLTKAVRNDRMELKFIALHGPDIITAEKGFNPNIWGCSDAITSDISRAVDFRYPSTLRKLAGCSPWSELNVDRACIERLIRTKLRGHQESVIKEAMTKAMQNIDTIWVCRQTRHKPKGNVRFLKSDLMQQSTDAPSSTKIRAIIVSSPPEELEKNLRGIALHPDVLVKYLKELPKPVKRAAPRELKEWKWNLDCPVDWKEYEKTIPERWD